MVVLLDSKRAVSSIMVKVEMAKYIHLSQMWIMLRTFKQYWTSLDNVIFVLLWYEFPHELAIFFTFTNEKFFFHFDFCHSKWNSFCWAERNSSCPLATHCKLTKHFGTMKLQYITPCESQMLCRWPQHNRRGNIQCP